MSVGGHSKYEAMAASSPPPRREVLGEYEVFLDSLCFLGRGAYGDVYRGRHRADGTTVAVKRIDQSKVSLEFLNREICVLRAASGHENVVSLLHHELKNGFMQLVVQFCEAGDMNAYFTKHNVRDVEARRLLQDCVAAIHHLHSMKPTVVHRDIKPANYLITYINGISRVKACDFGLSRIIPDEILFDLTTVCGSPHYMAPELYEPYVKYNTPVDIFALGMLLWALLHRKPKRPLKALTNGTQGIGMGWTIHGEAWDPFPVSPSSDSPLLALAKRMMRFKPEKRPDINRVYRIVQRHIVEKDGQGGEELRKQLKKKDRQIETKGAEIERLEHDGRIEEELRREVMALRIELRKKDREIQFQTRSIQSNYEEIEDKDAEIETLESELREQDREIEVKDAKIKRLKRELAACMTEVREKDREIQFQCTSIQSNNEVKDAEIGRLKSDLASLQKAAPVPRDSGAPTIITIMPNLTMVKRQKLSYKANCMVGMSRTGCVLECGSHLYKWDECLSEVSRVRRPRKVAEGCVKYELPDGRWALRDDDENPTYLLSKDMGSKIGEHIGLYQVLFGVVNGALLNGTKMSNGSQKYKLSLYSADHAHLPTMHQAVCGYGVSVCGHPSGQLAITDFSYSKPTLRVYASASSSPCCIELDYNPSSYCGVTSVNDVIIVADDSAGLYMYDWRGRQLGGRVDLWDMGVKEEEIMAIGGVGEDKLMVAAGSDSFCSCEVTALYVYKLRS